MYIEDSSITCVMLKVICAWVGFGFGTEMSVNVDPITQLSSTIIKTLVVQNMHTYTPLVLLDVLIGKLIHQS